MAVADPRDPGGENFGRYRLIERVGSGGMAEVFRAVMSGPMGFEKVVALKRVHPHLTRDNPGLARAFVNEARVSGLLQHPHVVQVHDFGEVDGAWYLAMEFVEGWTLDRVLDARAGRGLPPLAACELAVQVCDGLQYAHNLTTPAGAPLGLIHRDLKPANLILDRRGSVRILDFGIAKAAMNLFQTTATGITRGTPRYMSPEQVEGRSIDHRSDLFALGVCLFESLTGGVLFHSESVGALLLKVMRADVEARLKEVEAVAPSTVPLLRRLLRRDPTDRPRDADEVRRALIGLSRGLPAPSLRELAEQLSREELPTRGPRKGPVSAPSLEVDPTGTADLAAAAGAGSGGGGARAASDSPGRGQAAPRAGSGAPAPPTFIPESFDPSGDLPATALHVLKASEAEPVPLLSPPPRLSRPAGHGPDPDPASRAAVFRRPWWLLGASAAVAAALVGVSVWIGRADPGAGSSVIHPADIEIRVAGETLGGGEPVPTTPVAHPGAPAGSAAGSEESRSGPVAGPTGRAGVPRAPAGPAAAGGVAAPPDPRPPVPAVRPDSDPGLESVAAPPPAPSPRAAEPVPAAVHLFHRPFDAASVGTVREVLAEVRGASEPVEVRCRYRPAGTSDWRTLRLAPSGEGRYRGELRVTDQFLGGIEYYLVVEPRGGGPPLARDGDARKPHRVVVY